MGHLIIRLTKLLSFLFSRSNQKSCKQLDSMGTLFPFSTSSLTNTPIPNYPSTIPPFPALRKLLCPPPTSTTGDNPIAALLMGNSGSNPVTSGSPAPPAGTMSLIGGLGSISNTCAKCGITFRMTSDLVYHMRTHHSRHEKER